MYNALMPFAICTLIGGIFLVIGIVIFIGIKKKETSCTSKTYGKVVDLVKNEHYDMDRNYSSSWSPVFEYNIGELNFKKIYSYGESKSKYTIGQDVEIYYNPEDYNEYYIPSDDTPKTFAAIFCIVGAGVIIVGILFSMLA
jgi:hypothetical protein